MNAPPLNGKPYFVVTVDTEADDAWNHPEEITLSNLREIPRFQALCDAYHVVPTYLVTYECATRDESLAILKPIADTGRCEIGHHLHVWTTPPFEKAGSAGVDLAWIHAYQFELSDGLFEEKAECLYDAIEKAFGRPPTSHRAGRWGIDQRTVNWMIRRGFLVDSSVVPFMSASKGVGKREPRGHFYGAPYIPYAWPSEPAAPDGESFLTEIPVSVYVPGSFLEKLCANYLARKWPGVDMVDRLYRRLLGGEGILWPAPQYREGTHLRILNSAMGHRVPVLNLMLHSSELSLGCSPFSRTKEDAGRVWTILEGLFQYVHALGVTPASLSSVAGRVTVHKNT